jgi:hypothetical protein
MRVLRSAVTVADRSVAMAIDDNICVYILTSYCRDS